MRQGILILDNNCYGLLSDPGKLARLRANARVADVVPYASELNLVEAASTPVPRVRDVLLSAMRELADGRPLLPWPFQIAKKLGQAMLDGAPRVWIGESGKEWYLDDPGAVAAIQAKIDDFRLRIEKPFAEMHAKRRTQLQRKMKTKGIADTFGSAKRFLDDHWFGSETRQVFAEATWTALGLAGKAPMESINRNELWRLLLDAEGVAVYERALAAVQPKAVQRLDLLQLMYIADAPKRLLATADLPFLRAAGDVLHGRYPNARAIHIDEMVA